MKSTRTGALAVVFGLGILFPVFVKNDSIAEKHISSMCQFSKHPSVVNEICKARPLLQDERVTTGQKLDMIRDWVAVQIPIATSETHPEGQWWYEPASDLIEDATSGVNGYWCAGTAHILAQIYKMFEFDAFLYNYGDIEIGTHVITLVHYADMISVQDAYLNVTYVNESGQHVDFRDMLTLIEQGQSQRLLIESGSTLRPLIAGTKDEALAMWPARASAEVLPCTRLPSGNVRCVAQDFSFEALREWGPYDELASMGASDGYAESIMSAMLYPIGITDPDIVETTPSPQTKLHGAVAVRNFVMSAFDRYDALDRSQ